VQRHSFTPVVDNDDGGFDGGDVAGGGRREQEISGVGSREREREGSGLGERENRLENIPFILLPSIGPIIPYRDLMPLDNRRNQGRWLLLPFIETLIGPIMSYRALLHFVFHDLFLFDFRENPADSGSPCTCP
jgi:hypothetical protein